MQTLRAFARLAVLASRPGYFVRVVWNAIWAASLAELIQRQSIDRIHAHFADIPTETALFLSRIARIPMSFSVHARDVFVAPVGLARKCGAADVVFACNSDAAATVRPFCAHVALIHHGLDFNSGIWNEVCCRRAGKTANRRAPQSATILAVGRFVNKKGFHILIEALSLLQQRGLCFSAYLVGGGPEGQRLATLVSKHHLSQTVHLRGFLRHEELAELWSQCDVFIQPSIVDREGDRDGIPNTVIEALACGIPVIASDLPAMRDVIRHQETGFLFPPGDSEALALAIERAIASDLSRLGNVGRQLVRTEFDVAVNAMQILKAWGEAPHPAYGG